MRSEYRNNYIKLGLKVAYYRKLKSLTQEELADIMGCSPSFIGQIEAPNMYKSIAMDTLFRLAKALEIEPYKLLKFDD